MKRGTRIASRALALALCLGVVAWPVRADMDAARAALRAGDHAAALAGFRPLAEAGDAAAQTQLGILLRDGLGTPRDPQAAAEWFRRAADQGNPAALAALGLLHRAGTGVARDLPEAFRLLRRAAESGDPDGLLESGRMLASGEGTPRDLVAAAASMRAAAAAGQPQAPTALRDLLIAEERNATPDESLPMLRAAAATGDVLAQIRLGLWLEAGLGGAPDPTEARRWLTVGLSTAPTPSVSEAALAVFRARAQLALGRLDRADAWAIERAGWTAARPDAARPAAPAAAGRVTLEATAEAPAEPYSAPIALIQDAEGRRLIAEPVTRDFRQAVPDRAGLMLLGGPKLGGLLRILRVLVDGEPVALDAEAADAVALALDPDRLRAGAPARLATLPAPAAQPRLGLRGIRAGRVDFLTPDSTAAWLDVAVVPDQTLGVPAWSAPRLVLQEGTEVEITVDGQPVLTVGAPPLHEIELELDADRLRGARLLPPAERQRGAIDPDDGRPAPRDLVMAADRRVIGRLTLPHHSRIPQSAGGDPVMAAVAAATMTIFGELDGSLREARRNYQIALRAHGPDAATTRERLSTLANLNRRAGNTAQALDQLDRVLLAGRDPGPSDLLTLAELYLGAGRTSLAEREARRALGVLARTGPPGGDASRIIEDARARVADPNAMRGGAGADRLQTAYRLLGRIYAAQGQDARAELYLTRQVQLADLAGYDSFVSVEAEPLLQLEAVLRRLGRTAAADATLRRAHLVGRRLLFGADPPEPFKLPLDLSYAQESWGPPDFSRIKALNLTMLADAYGRLGRWAEAEPLLARAAAIERNIHGAGSLAAARAESRLAEALLRRGDVAGALKASRGAVAALERERPMPLQPTLLHLETLDAARRRSLEPTARLVDEALRTMQRGKASDTAGAVAAMAARFAAGSDALAAAVRAQQDVAAQRQRRERELAEAGAGPIAQRDLAREAELRAEIAALSGRLTELTAELGRRFPRYLELTDPRPLGTAELQKRLRPGEAMLVYQLGETASWLAVVRSDRASLVPLPIGARAIAALVRQLRDTVDPARLAELDPDRFAKLEPLPFDLAAAHALWRAVLAPVGRELEGVKDLLVVPDGALHQIPFALLVTAPPPAPVAGQPDYRRAAWLFRRHAITTLPTVSSLVSLRAFAGRTRAPDPLVGIGNPSLDGTPGTSRGRRVSLLRGGQVDLAELRQLDPLPDTADELRALARTLKAPPEALLLADRASESVLRQQQLGRARILAFATHGLVSGELGGLREPALVLTPPRQVQSEEDDGILTASEIARGLSLDADMVILSACNTAAGDGGENAEGLSGLAKAFFYAGSRSILVSHWSVISEAAVRLTTGAFEAQAKQPGIGRAEALRRSMQALLDDRARPIHAHPMFWAPFVIAGEGGAEAAPAAPAPGKR